MDARTHRIISSATEDDTFSGRRNVGQRFCVLYTLPSPYRRRLNAPFRSRSSTYRFPPYSLNHFALSKLPSDSGDSALLWYWSTARWESPIAS
jgi:hypothetical protein